MILHPVYPCSRHTPWSPHQNAAVQSRNQLRLLTKSVGWPLFCAGVSCAGVEKMAGSLLGAVIRSCLLTFSCPNTTSMRDTGTPNRGARNRTMWSVALPSLGAAVTLTLSCVPLGLPIASLLADGLPRMLTTRVSPSQAKNESPVRLRGVGDREVRAMLP